MLVSVGFIIIGITIYLLIKQHETRMVLFISGLIMAVIAGMPMAPFSAFSQAIKNNALIEPIVAAMGFAAILKVTECDKHLILSLAKLLKKVKFALVPGAVLATAFVNTSITSAAGCSAAVGAILIPLLIGLGVRPVMAGTAVFVGTYGSAMLNPGFGQNVIVAAVAKTTPIEVVANHATAILAAGLIAAIVLSIEAYLLKEHTGYVPENILREEHDMPISPLKAIVPIIPLALLLLGSAGIVPAFKGLAISHAMIIGVFVAAVVTRLNPSKLSKQFFQGFGDGFAQVFGIITCALVFVSGIQALGIVQLLINSMIENPAIAKLSATFGPFILAVTCGSGEAASIAFNKAITADAAQFGLIPIDLGSLAAIAGALGRTMSPIAGAAIICAGFAGVNPLELSKRTAIPMILATISTMLLLVYLK